MFHILRTQLLACGAAFACCAASPAAEPPDPSPANEFPPELVKFQPALDSPVFQAGGTGDWDAKIRERGWILREGNRWRMWYTGYDGERSSPKHLGLATSRDGIRWERHPDNPIYDESWVEDMMVVKHESTYYMFAEGRDDQAQLLTSDDGLKWTRRGTLDVRQADGTPIEPGPYGTPTGYHENGTWYLFYERRDAGIWLATSRDMRVWTNLQDEPVLLPGPEEYDRDLVALNQIVRHRGRYYAYYHGASNERTPRLWANGVAVSDDLLRWKKSPHNPLHPIDQNKSSGILVPDGQGFRFYTMHDKVELHLPRE
jgi:beta-1,2-mannobiose phosphorylase / 1,2-beta-oligomannan phosphorylase